MASSAKTPFLGLHQWAKGDQAERSDLSQDNSLIDSAYGGLAESIKSIRSYVLNLTLALAGWSGDGPYVQRVNADGIKGAPNESNGVIDRGAGTTKEQRDAYAAADIEVTGQGDGWIECTAYGERPSVNIPIRIWSVEVIA